MKPLTLPKWMDLAASKIRKFLAFGGSNGGWERVSITGGLDFRMRYCSIDTVHRSKKREVFT